MGQKLHKLTACCSWVVSPDNLLFFIRPIRGRTPAFKAHCGICPPFVVFPEDSQSVELGRKPFQGNFCNKQIHKFNDVFSGNYLFPRLACISHESLEIAPFFNLATC